LTETAPYEVVKQIGDAEIRSYPPLILATTSSAGNDDPFNLLFARAVVTSTCQPFIARPFANEPTTPCSNPLMPGSDHKRLRAAALRVDRCDLRQVLCSHRPHAVTEDADQNEKDPD
jgi:hypothetical protein